MEDDTETWKRYCSSEVAEDKHLVSKWSYSMLEIAHYLSLQLTHDHDREYEWSMPDPETHVQHRYHNVAPEAGLNDSYHFYFRHLAEILPKIEACIQEFRETIGFLRQPSDEDQMRYPSKYHAVFRLPSRVQELRRAANDKAILRARACIRRLIDDIIGLDLGVTLSMFPTLRPLPETQDAEDVVAQKAEVQKRVGGASEEGAEKKGQMEGGGAGAKGMKEADRWQGPADSVTEEYLRALW
ncbi:hypothetical protein NA57DRAFT_76155 [Rhizodiscina lignyota]|uniref:Uncharacterized protein n=1 Tax=Rhizodiscina lignyota TaxID=1504668 RepID=A0A9P4M5P7_9PEZI|nr:hypothetical protein NA57DRAFT_76155 [Rhizodiscina lignyota]